MLFRSRVREAHKILEAIVRPVDDQFWNTYYPPNGWNCRCSVEQLSDGVETDLSDKNLDGNNIPDVWRFNSGKSKLIFSDSHPYYKVDPRDQGLMANNFNLPLP